MSNNPRTNGILTVKECELIGIAISVACMSLQPDATRRHIRAALSTARCAMMEEIMEVLKLCVAAGVEACHLAVPILAEKLERAGRST